MNRRQMLCLLAAAGTLLATPLRAWAASPDTLAAKAQEALSAGDTEQAQTLLLEAVAKDPRNDRVHALLGRTFMQRGQPREALAHFQQAVRLNPEDTLSRVMMETLREFPQPAASATGKPHPVARPSSSLSLDAKKERQAILDGSDPEQGPWRLLIDAGHGGADPGVVGDGPRESDVALDLALRLGRVLVASRDKVTVSFTRTADVALPGWARAALAGYYGADAMISLHATRLRETQQSGVTAYAFAPRPGNTVAGMVADLENVAFRQRTSSIAWDGQMFFTGIARQVVQDTLVRRGHALAKALSGAMAAASPLPVREPQGAPLRLLAEAAVPAVLLEVGLLSNAGDAALLSSPDKRQALAQALATSILAAMPALRDKAARP